MKSYLSRIIIYNRAPFDSLDLSFDENGVYVLTGINGQGKTTIISYLVDSWFELVRNHYGSQFDGHENTYHRIAAQMYVIDDSKPSIVYVRYRIGGRNIDYVNLEGKISESQYESIIHLKDKIPYSRIEEISERSEHIKLISSNADEKSIVSWLSNNVVTCFPAFRYELPYHLTDFYKQKYKFKKDFNLSGYLKNPLVVISGIEGITDWLMDLVLDMKQYDADEGRYETDIWANVGEIITAALSSKFKGEPLRLGLGRRNAGATRIAVVRRSDKKDVYPSIFGMSSGELSILSMFVEILRQADNLSTNIKLSHIYGIVLIDEIDKHLHIKLQKEVIPSMLALFPNVQFILSTHSPFLTIGLAEDTKRNERTKIIDLDQGGVVSEPQSIDIYSEVYEMMIGENNNFKQLYDELYDKLKDASKPLVITEGKTDVKHIRNAIVRLGKTDVDVDFFEIGDQEWGDTKLKSMLEYLSKLDNSRKIIGVFDRDDDKMVSFSSDATKPYKLLRQGSNVYACCIPLVNEDEYGTKISIEHYYHKKDLLKPNSEGRRIFLGEEFLKTCNSRDGKYQTRSKNLPHKIDVNGIIDEKVYLSSDLEHTNSVAMTKEDFANLISSSTDYASDFDFSNFSKLIDVICMISQ